MPYDQDVVIGIIHHVVAGAKYTVRGEHEAAGGAAVPIGAALAFIKAGNDEHAFAGTRCGFGGGEALLAGGDELDVAFLAIQLFELLEQFGGFDAILGAAQLDCFEVDFGDQLAVVNDAAG